MSEKRIGHQIRNVERALEAYDFSEPFSRFLSKFYKSNRQMGSSDRRMTSRLCYNLFRLGGAFPDLPLNDRLVISEFLCEQESLMVQFYDASLHQRIQRPLEEKIAIILGRYGEFLEHVFLFSNELSKGVDLPIFLRSFFVQPDLYIRAKRASVQKVERVLSREGIPSRRIADQTFALTNGQNLQTIKELDGAFEVQDLSSQYTGDHIELLDGEKWWDCCAASGGKSLMLLDKNPKIKLLVSDIRMSILRNLEERFDRAGITVPYRKKILDLSNPVDHLMKGEVFDGLLIDAPCSGSGTWGRTPEVLQSFEINKIADFSVLQQKICKQAIPYLKPKGKLIYITCSVFEKENEDTVQFLVNELGLVLDHQKLIEGYHHKADSMFIAVLSKP